jgi:signal transduction histidine kinase
VLAIPPERIILGTDVTPKGEDCRRRYLAGLAGQAERERTAEVERARQQIMEERMRIARELHDVVAHTLAVITVQAGVGRRLMAAQGSATVPATPLPS